MSMSVKKLQLAALSLLPGGGLVVLSSCGACVTALPCGDGVASSLSPRGISSSPSLAWTSWASLLPRALPHRRRRGACVAASSPCEGCVAPPSSPRGRLCARPRRFRRVGPRGHLCAGVRCPLRAGPCLCAGLCHPPAAPHRLSAGFRRHLCTVS